MNTVRMHRDLEATPETVRELIRDVQPFMEAAGFADVTVTDEGIEIVNTVGFLEIELDLAIVEREGAVLAYEQRDGIFEEMWTAYEVEPTEDGTRVSAITEFTLDVSVIGPIFDATVVERQRRHELSNQFDYLAAETR